MLMLDDNDLKLLKMKEKLLEISADDDRQSILKDYEKLAIEIDKNVYDSLIDRIKNSEYHNQSFEEQLSFLSELECEYDRINELQHRFKNTYGKYSDNELELSNLENIFIDVIRERISNISGYLINVKNIEVSEKELEKLSEKLILEEQKKQSNGVKLRALDDDLRDNALKVEGRVYTSMGDVQYTSVVEEYKALGLDLEELLSNGELLGNKLKEFEEKNNEQEKSLKVAEISYNSMSDDSYKDVYETIKRDAIRARYELSLLKIVRLLYKVTDEYDTSKEKREQLCDLIKYRVSCLDSLGIKFSIDPFSRIRVKQQLEIIDSIKDNTKDITKTRRDIFDLHSSIEAMQEKNDKFLAIINADVSLMNDDFSMDSVDISLVESVEDEVVVNKKVAELNQVVSVTDIPNNFMLSRVNEKVSGVIKRVNQMINSPLDDEVVKPFEVAPQLVIEDSPVLPDLAEDNYDMIVDDLDREEEESDDYSQIDEFESQEDLGVVGVDLFQEVEPFVETPLFEDKYEDSVVAESLMDDSDSLTSEGLVNIKNNKPSVEFKYNSLEDDSDVDEEEDSLDDIMPEPFWMIQEEPVEEDTEEMVSDEFPDLTYLDDEIEQSKDYTKVRSRAA